MAESILGRWYVAAARPGLEYVAAKNLAAQGWHVAVPSVPLERRAFGYTQAPVFKGYVFIWMDPFAPPPDVRGWQSINGTRGVIRLLPQHSEEPEALPLGFFEAVLRAECEGAFQKKDVTDLLDHLTRNDLVSIDVGPFRGHTARYQYKRKGQLALLIYLLGRDFEVMIPKHHASLPLPSDSSPVAVASANHLERKQEFQVREKNLAYARS